jgi:hypothetical protein
MGRKMYRVYDEDMEGEYTRGYVKLSEEELKNLDCRDSDYEYEEVVVSKGLGYLELYAEVVKNNAGRLKREEEYEQWLKDNPKERERLEKRDKKRCELMDKAKGNIQEMMELTGKFMAEDIEERMFNQSSKLSCK